MLKKFLRTSVLTLGAGLCVLATLQNQSHAGKIENDLNTDVTTTFKVFVKYKDSNGQEKIKWDYGSMSDNVGAHSTSQYGHPVAYGDLVGLGSVVTLKGGVPLHYGFSLTVEGKDASGNLVTETLTREGSNPDMVYDNLMSKPLKIVPNAQGGIEVQ